MFTRTLTNLSLLALIFSAAGLPAQGQVSPSQTGTAPASNSDAIFELLLESRFPSRFDQIGAMRRLEQALPVSADLPARGALEELILSRWNGLRRAEEIDDLSWLEKLQASNKLSGLGDLQALALLANWHRQQGRFDQAKALRKKDGWLRNGLAIGPFGDYGTTYYGVSYSPEFGRFDLQTDHAGRYGKIRWRKVKLPLSRTQIDAGQDLPSSKRDGCHYVLFQLEAQQSQKAWIDILCSGSYELFWNEDRVAEVRRGIDYEGIRGFRPIVLRKGWNQILVKTTNTRVRSFALRLLDTEGRAIQGLKLETEMLVHGIAAPVPQTLEMPPPLSLEGAYALRRRNGNWVLESVQKPSATMLAYMGHWLASHGKPDVGLSLCRTALSQRGKSASIRAAHLDCLRLARHIPFDMRRLDIRRAIQEAGSLNEGHAWFLTQKVNRLFQDDKREEALRLVRAHRAKDPKKFELVALEYNILRQWGWTEESERILDTMLSLRPQSSRLILEKASRIERRGNMAKARDMIHEALEAHPGDRNLLGRATRLARRMGDYVSRAALLKRAHREQPDARSALEAMAWLAADQDQFDESARLLGLAAKKAPGDPSIQEYIGDALYLAGKTDDAREAYEKSLAAKPADHTLRRWLYRQKGMEDEFPEAQSFRIDGMKVAMGYK